MTTDFYAELAEYCQRDRQLVEARCLCASTELAWLFPSYKDRVLEYYKETDLYIFGLSRYQTRLQEKDFHNWLAQFIRNYNIKSVLDYGGGIGEYTIVACKEGADTTYTDVWNSRTMVYANYRFAKHNVQPTIEGEGYKIDRDFDLIVAMDVLEHLPDPEPVIKDMAKHCTYLISNPELIKYTYMFPEHISHPDLTPYFYNVQGYLWKRRENA